MGLAVKFAVLHELSMNFQVMGIANHGAAFPLDHQNGSNTLYSSCLTGDFVTQSASSHGISPDDRRVVHPSRCSSEIKIKIGWWTDSILARSSTYAS
jgi:hypothetical protein